MKTTSLLLFATALCVGGCHTIPANSNPARQADITVNYQDPDKFTDARDSATGPTSQYYLDQLTQHIQETAAARLRAGQRLNITFQDIDLAGDIPPGSIHDIRIIKAIYIPRMELHFRLTDATGALLKEGDRRLTNLDFQFNIAAQLERNDPLFYDKQLLTDWINKEFPRP